MPCRSLLGLLSALLCRPGRLWRVVKLASLNNVLLIVVGSIAIDVDLHNQLVLLPILDVARIESETVLTSQQRIDAAKNFRQLPFKRDREIRTASLSRKRRQGVVSLQTSSFVLAHPLCRLLPLVDPHTSS